MAYRLSILLFFCCTASVFSAGLEDFSSDLEWQEAANGIWRCEIGDMTKADYYSAIWALNAIERLGDKADSIREAVGQLPKKPAEKFRGDAYVGELIKQFALDLRKGN